MLPSIDGIKILVTLCVLGLYSCKMVICLYVVLQILSYFNKVFEKILKYVRRKDFKTFQCGEKCFHSGGCN